jgi:hypothetical protein
MDLGSVEVGSEGRASLKLEGGKLIISIIHAHESGDIEVSIKEDVKYFLEKLKTAIPGNWDDLVISVVQEALP